jgi:hypothetical protein
LAHSSAKPSHQERSHLRDPFEVAVYVQDAETVLQSGLGDEEIGNGCAMPHPVMVGKVALKPKCTIEDVRWGSSDFEAV